MAEGSSGGQGEKKVVAEGTRSCAGSLGLRSERKANSSIIAYLVSSLSWVDLDGPIRQSMEEECAGVLEGAFGATVKRGGSERTEHIRSNLGRNQDVGSAIMGGVEGSRCEIRVLSAGDGNVGEKWEPTKFRMLSRHQSSTAL
jgi:hypothetical protein